jgi:hypothetical protein
MAGDDPKQILATILADRPDLVVAAAAIFDHAQYLLDDDERLTKTGALDGVGRDQLRVRALELLGGPATAADDEDDEDDE